MRRGKNPDDFVIVLCNFTPVVRDGYRIGVPIPGMYKEVFNSDAQAFYGSGVTNPDTVGSEAQNWQGREQSLSLNVPPLGATVLKVV